MADLRWNLEGIYICAAGKAICSSCCSSAQDRMEKRKMRKQKNNNSTIQNLFFFPSPINELIYVHFGLAQNTLLEFRGSEISVEPTTERKGSKWRSTGTQIWASALSKSDHMQPHRLVKSVTPCFLLLCTKTRCVFTDISFSTSTGFNTLFPLAYTHLTPQPYLCQENCWYGHRLKCIEENNPPPEKRGERELD